MDISEILQRISRAAIEQIRAEWTPADPTADLALLPDTNGTASSTVVRVDRSGWVQQIDTGALLACVPDGGTLTVETFAGRFAIEGTRFCSLSPPISDEDRDAVERALLAAVSIGDTRTMQQDVSYGLRQLVDVAVKALSPGINDPTTAQEAIFQTAAVLSELLRHDPASPVRTDGNRTIVIAEQSTHVELTKLAFDETRRAGAGHPTVCEYLLVSIESLVESLEAASLGERTLELRRQARLVVDGCGATGLLDEDIAMVRQTYRDKFVR